nr:MAG TPA: Head protein [Caudoviricetes sp.]
MTAKRRARLKNCLKKERVNNMPNKPANVSLDSVTTTAAKTFAAENPNVTVPKMYAATAQILNTIRDNASANYRDYVPAADPTLAASVREIGGIIMNYPALQNEFLSALMNRIGRVIITSKMFYNPWAGLKKGLLEFGETVEEIFVNIAKPFQFDPAVAETEVFKREIPDVRAAFHILNYQKFYKATISNDQLRQAFLSWQGITDLIAKIVDAMYTGANYDEFLTMKYMIARNILNGRMNVTEIAPVSPENAKGIVSTIKGVSNTWEFPSTDYNISGVTTFTMKNDQFILLNAKFDAVIDVEVLASAFNMDKAEFMGRRILVDSFGNLDTKRLDLLFASDPNYVPITEEELTALDAIPAIMVDRDWFMIFDNFYNFTENYNGQGLYWNYFYHTWKTFSVSPFANNTVFISGAPTVTGVTVSPPTASVFKGQRIHLNATVVTTNFAPKSVIWSLTGATSTDTTIDIYGNLSVGEDETGTTITVTATSTFNPSKAETATITVATPAA